MQAARPLYVYIKTSSLERVEVETFLPYLLDAPTSREALAIPLTSDQLDEARTVWTAPRPAP